MTTLFPFGFPAPTAFYLTLYVVTLAIHVLFMNYVLAGTAYLTYVSLRGRPYRAGSLPDHPATTPASKFSPTIAGVLADWIPVMLSGAITAGVAPLLFLQILYQREFYTANLLLFNRWMSILPVLIIGFYALYLVRTDWLSRQRLWGRVLATFFTFACVAFVAYSWTENHLLSVEAPDQWRTFYATDRQVFYTPAIIPRLFVWAFGSLPTLCVWLGWQLWYRQSHGEAPPADEHVRLAKLALLGIVLAAIGGIWYYVESKSTVRALLTGDLAKPYFAFASIGLIAQAIAWILQWLAPGFDRRWLGMAAAGLVATLAGMTVCREVVRLDAIGPDRLAELYSVHAAAANIEGFPVFLGFAVLNLGLIALCFFLVRRARETHVRPE